jgi:magnesium transporter
MITVFRSNGSAGACGWVPSAELPASAADVTGEDVCWVDLADPTAGEEQAVFERFLKVHALTLEDVTKPHRKPGEGAHFPKVEEFPDYLFVVVNPLPPELVHGGTAALGVSAHRLVHRERPQLSAVLTRNVLITHHYKPLGCVDDVRAFLDRHAEHARRGPDYLFHLILDDMVDEYDPVVDRIASGLDRLETRVFKDPSPKLLARMLRLKRLVVALRKTLILEREVLARLTRGEFKLVESREIAYYRNVFDHLVRYTELIEGAREMVSDLMQTHLSAVSNRLNEIMKVLTMISTVVLPMTLVAGVYGMNFKHMPELEWEYGYPMSLGLMVLVGAASFALFRWKRWI